MGMGIASAAGSFGQFAMLPGTLGLIGWLGWSSALLVLGLLAWVVFRAPDLGTAVDIWQGMAGANGVALPRGLAAYGRTLPGLDLQFSGIRWIDFSGIGVPALIVACVLAWYAPNTQQIFRRYGPALERVAAGTGRWQWRWQPSRSWSLALAVLFLGCAFSMNRVSEFLYFQF